MKGIKLSDLPPHLRKQAEAQLGNRAAVRRTGKEPSGRDALVEEATGPLFSKPVRITVAQWKRSTRWDADNIETKGLVDGLVEGGAIKGDTVKEAPVIIRIGHPCKTEEEERTVITVEEI